MSEEAVLYAAVVRPTLAEWEAAGRALVAAYEALTSRADWDQRNPSHLAVIRAEQALRRLVERVPAGEG